MKIIIKPVVDRKDESDMIRVRRRVFEREMRGDCSGLQLPGSDGCLHLLARDESTGGPVATLSVFDASRDYEIRERLGLGRDANIRVARYAQLAVLNRYRGMYLPLALMIEARQRFVRPNRFHYSWLLFDAERAESSSFCRLLDFTPSEHILSTPLGRARILVCEEQAKAPSVESCDDIYWRPAPQLIPSPNATQPLYM